VHAYSVRCFCCTHDHEPFLVSQIIRHPVDACATSPLLIGVLLSYIDLVTIPKADGGATWSKPVPAYGNMAQLTNGSTLHFVRRERPWLLFAKNEQHDSSMDSSYLPMRPTHLLNGVSDNTGMGFSWTFVHPLLA
jgi:hypothetical protein